MVSMDLLYSILHRLRAGNLYYRLLSPVAHGRVPCAPADVDAALRRLAALSPDAGRSCLHANAVCAPEHDLTVIVPAYNAEKYLADCLDSVLEQRTRHSVRVVVVDDGSTDRTPRLLETYSRRDDVTVIRQRNGGLSAARNAALARLRGRYVMFLDADDRLLPGAVDALMDKVLALDADIVEGGMERFDDGGRVWMCGKPVALDNVSVASLSGYACGKVYKSQLFADVRFPIGYWFEDTLGPYVVYPRALRRAVVSAVVYAYRDNPAGISHRSHGNPRVLDALWVTRRMLADSRSLGIRHDTAFLDMVLTDLRNTYCRVASLRNRHVSRDLFVALCGLLREYFPAVSSGGSSALSGGPSALSEKNSVLTADASLRPLEASLRNGDFAAFRLYCYCFPM